MFLGQEWCVPRWSDNPADALQNAELNLLAGRESNQIQHCFHRVPDSIPKGWHGSIPNITVCIHTQVMETDFDSRQPHTHSAEPKETKKKKRKSIAVKCKKCGRLIDLCKTQKRKTISVKCENVVRLISAESKEKTKLSEVQNLVRLIDRKSLVMVQR